jgi:hypothetical protein
MKSKYIIPFLLIFSMFCSYARGQDISVPQDSAARLDTIEYSSPGGFDFFASEEPLEVTLSFDIREFLKTRNEPKYSDANITVKISGTDSISEKIKLKPRGIMRLSICAFPPIMLKFKNGKNGSESQLGQGTLKLVTHCNKSCAFENYVFKEYLTYKLYNLITPFSFKTRLVKINYRDVAKPENSFTAYGFLIENEDKMAERNQAVIINAKNISQKNMISDHMARVAIFNYMIGNTDWSIPFQHNVKVMVSLKTPSEKGIPVAYDFDYSGLVNTYYAVPAEELPIESVTERHYLGICMEEEELKPIIEEFMDKQEQFLETINDFEYLPKGDKKEVEYYVNSFYKIYKNQNILISDLNRTCKQLY